jgi:hypothetical protein
MRAYNNQPKQRKVRDEPSLPSKASSQKSPAGRIITGWLVFTARHRSLPPTRTENWTIEGPTAPFTVMRPIGIRKALGCRQAGRVQRPPQSGPGRPARILAELRKCLRARCIGTRDADTIGRIYPFGTGQSPARAALAMASGKGPPGRTAAMGGWQLAIPMHERLLVAVAHSRAAVPVSPTLAIRNPPILSPNLSGSFLESGHNAGKMGRRRSSEIT